LGSFLYRTFSLINYPYPNGVRVLAWYTIILKYPDRANIYSGNVSAVILPVIIAAIAVLFEIKFNN